MTDPRNKMHDKRVQQEKKHNHEEINPGAAETTQPGKKPAMIKEEAPPQPENLGDSDPVKTPGSSS